MRITVTQTVSCWGYETSTYDVDTSMDELRAEAAKYHGLGSVDEVEDWHVADYLCDEHIATPDSYEFDMQEITYRDLKEMEVTP